RERADDRPPRCAAHQRRVLGDGSGAGALRGGSRAARRAHAGDDPGAAHPDDPGAGRMSAPPVRRRLWAEVRWRQFRNAPRPVVRAVASSPAVAIFLAAGYVLSDLALSRGAALPGGDLRVLAVTVYV